MFCSFYVNIFGSCYNDLSHKQLKSCLFLRKDFAEGSRGRIFNAEEAFVEGFRGRILRKAAEGSKKINIFFVGRSSRKDLCGRIPRKDFQCRISICGRVPRKDFAEGCGRIQKNKRFFCWPIFAEGSLRKDSAEGFSMRNKHLRKESAEGFCGRIPEGSAEGSSQKDKNLFVR